MVQKRFTDDGLKIISLSCRPKNDDVTVIT